MVSRDPIPIPRRSFLQGALASLPFLGRAAAPRRGRSSSGRPPEGGPRKHRILSCNIRVPLPRDDRAGHGWKDRREVCAQVIASRKPDIIGLQECYGVQLEFLKKRLTGFESFGQAAPGPVFNPLNAILYSRSRYRLVSAGGFWLSETPHVAGSSSWDSARPRWVNWVDLEDRASGAAFRFWNTHLDHKGAEARKRQARMILEAAAPYGEAPQILTGDLNTGASTLPVRILKDGGWTGTYSAVHGPGDPGFTYHAFKGARYRSKKPKGKIDWIFCRGGFRPAAAEIIKDHPGGVYPSDHYFLSADLVLEPREKKREK